MSLYSVCPFSPTYLMQKESTLSKLYTLSLPHTFSEETVENSNLKAQTSPPKRWLLTHLPKLCRKKVLYQSLPGTHFNHHHSHINDRVINFSFIRPSPRPNQRLRGCSYVFVFFLPISPTYRVHKKKVLY